MSRVKDGTVALKETDTQFYHVEVITSIITADVRFQCSRGNSLMPRMNGAYIKCERSMREVSSLNGNRKPPEI